VVDYKTGPAPNDGLADVSDAEVRQLMLYVHLAQENGIRIARGVIARANGVRSHIPISGEDAAREARRARNVLTDYNGRVGEAFDVAAQPSPEACRLCPCIPFCEAFWRSATPEWADACGVHLEGIICDIETASIQGVALTTAHVDITRGTVAAGDAYIEQMPDIWIQADGAEALRAGETVRVVYGRLAGETPSRVFRVDRIATSIWTAASDSTSA
ncbi:MAG TPA: PD-(D/E)XK nuclease family protein, partial [Thermoanaerobaculia bacterium]